MTCTFATMFSGGELAGVGMEAAGWTHLWGVEHDAAIANVAHMNGFEGVVVVDVRCVDYTKQPRPDHLHASPVCKNASVANLDGKESEQDMETAEAVCRAIRALKPDTFTLENVFGYRKFRAYQAILRTLCENDYEFEQHHLNSADFGVAQTRMRLILRASRVGRLRPLEPTHRERVQSQGMFGEFEPLPSWIGWYAAIEDLIPTLPESKFAEWQLQRLPAELFGDCLIEGDAAGERCPTLRVGQEPSFTLKDSGGGRVHRAFLMPLNGENSGPAGQAEPAPTVTANHSAQKTRAFLVDGDNAGKNGPIAHQQARPAPAVVSSGGHRRAFLVEGTGHWPSQELRRGPSDEQCRMTTKDAGQPSVTLKGAGNGLKAFLLSDQSGAAGEGLQIVAPDEPATTIRSGGRGGAAPGAFIVDGKPASYDGALSVSRMKLSDPATTPTLTASQEKHPFRAWLSQGRVVSMTPRALARFMSLPDWYILPQNKKLAYVILGNGVPCLMMQRIAESLT